MNGFTIPKQSIFTRDKKEATTLSYSERGRKNGAKRAKQLTSEYGVTNEFSARMDKARAGSVGGRVKHERTDPKAATYLKKPDL